MPQSPQGRPASPRARVRLAVVGGGSTYTPELVDGFARLRDALPLEELVLIDPATERLELIGRLARRIFARQGHPGRVTWTDDLDAGVDGADAVLLQLRVGGQAARNQDETWPLDCGCVGQETTGAGGLAKALRTVPVVLGIAERVRRRNPDAWIVDFTNPVGIVTRALLTHGHKAVGLCNVAIGFQRKFAALLGVAPDQVELDHIGLNHLTWERAVRVGGEDVLPKLLTEHGEAVAEDLRMPRPLLDRLGVIPSYYLRYYYRHDEVVRELRSKPSRAAEVAAIEKRLLDLYADPALDEKPELLGRRGGAFYSEAAVALTSSLLGDTGDIQIVNTLNRGTLPFLPDDAVIEAPATVGAEGATPLPVRPLEPLFAGLVANVTAYEHLALEAALVGCRGSGRREGGRNAGREGGRSAAREGGRSAAREGGRNAVFAALLAHPLIGQSDYADRLTDELIAHNREHLTWA
ncbi:6-phospho-beta-glucosidase [Streptomyces piniterrae]|uniref:6-phospho-beta-glucosidase n=1 Tax=Streptomyces piniterrae TaxID=2571125 RepID=A0A4U0NNF5_9ACTN|nr:6-phospho-beta-glucosidase [Streptomyces piniterrae]TJZ55850.1 6-phospho-beta-glucosidase [Streptomyces piniterrae]